MNSCHCISFPLKFVKKEAVNDFAGNNGMTAETFVSVFYIIRNIFFQRSRISLVCVFDESSLKNNVYRTISLISNIRIYVQQQIHQDQRSRRSKTISKQLC